MEEENVKKPRRSAKSWFKDFFAGAAMGVANSIPGVSGGTIAVILNIYQKMIDAISNLMKKFIHSILILLPIGIGIIVAMIPCFFIFDYAFEYFAFGIVCLFAGLIIGSFPSITDEIKGERITTPRMITAIITCLIAIALGVLSIILGGKYSVQGMVDNHPWWFYILLLAVGFVSSISLIIPGISGSMMLLVLGFYKPMLELTTETLKHLFGDNFWINVSMLVTFFVGMLLGMFTIAKFMSFLLKKHHTTTFFGIIGFIIGSIITLFLNNEIWSYYVKWSNGEYNLSIWVEILLGIVLLIGGVVISYLLVRHSRKHKNEGTEEVEDSTDSPE